MRRWRYAYAWAVAMWLVAGPAQAQTGYAGTYTAGPARIEAQVTAWGPDCGVRPQSYTASERPKVVVLDQGAHLSLVFPDHTLKTNACWTPNPAVKLTSATAADNRWRAECRTAQGEPKKESGRYTVNATSPLTLELVEESDYDWQLNTSHCVAKVRITQALERPPAPGEARSPPASASTPTAVEEPKPACVPGPVTRIKLRPAEARVEPGQRLCFSARGFDAQGCPTDVDGESLAWELKKPNAARGTLKDGCFKAAESAADAEGVFRVLASREAVRAEAVVTVAAPDLSDITARRGSTGNTALPESPTASRATGDAGVKALAAGGGARGWLFALAAGLLAVVAAMVVFAMSRKRGIAAAAADVPLRAAGSRPSPEPSFTPAPVAAPPAIRPQVTPAPTPGPMAAPVSTEPLICPTCRHGYAPGTPTCPKDGSTPIPYAEFVTRAKQVEARAQRCPHCGAALATEAVFCGECGKRAAS